MSGADAEGGSEGEVGEVVFLGDFLYQHTGGSGIGDAFSKETVEDGAAGVLCLQIVLEIEGFKDVVGEADGEMGGIGVVGIGMFGFDIGLVCDRDIGVFFGIEEREAIGGAFGGGGFQIVEVIGFFLVATDTLAHMSEHFCGEGLPFFGGDVGFQ